MAKKLSAVREAGFAAVQAVADPELRAPLRESGLRFLAIANASPEDHAARIAEAAALGAIRVNLLYGKPGLAPADAARAWMAADDCARDHGLEADLEIHRGTCTESPEKAWEIADRFEQTAGRPIRLNFDLSHFGALRHLEPSELRPLLAERPRLLAQCRQAHMRPFSAQHTQVPVTDAQGGRHPAHVAWLPLARDFLSRWRAGAPAEAVLHVCPELGGVGSGYWLPGFPSPWDDAQRLRDDLRAFWNEVLSSP